MPVIRRDRQQDSVTVEVGANLMTSLQNAGIPVASSCGGDAVCGKCTLQIIEGAENLTPKTPEEEFLLERLKMAKNVRLACQAQVQGDITVDTRYW